MFSYKARVLALGAVLLSLTACQAVHTQQTVTTTTPPQATKPAPRQTLVVRGDIVPDEPEVAPVRGRTRYASSVPAIAEPAVSDPANETTAPAPDPAVTESPLPDPANADQPATTEPTPITPAPVDPQLENGPGTSMGFDPQGLVKDPVAALQTSVGGMPLWLVVAFALLAIISLVIGFSGPREPESRDEPAFA